MKLLTLNCHAWLEENQRGKIQIIARTIKENHYDVIALQEVNQTMHGNIVYGNVREDNYGLVLMEELKNINCGDYTMFWDFAHIGYEVYEEGICLITRHPLKETYSFFVSRNQDKNIWKSRKIVGATIDIAGTLIDFYSCHLGWWEDEEDPAKAQMDQLCRHIKNERLSLIMGDFNNDALHNSKGYEYLIGKGLYDTYMLAETRDSGVTVKGKIDGWDGNKKDLRLDLILTNRKVPVGYSRVMFNGDNLPVVSDHFGVEIEIEN